VKISALGPLKAPSLAAEQLYTNCKKDLSSTAHALHVIKFFQVLFETFLF